MCSSDLRSFREGGLRITQLPGQLVGAIHRRLGAGRQRVIIHQIMLPEILERGGHLFKVVNFGPPFIGRALALGHALLNVDNQIDAPGRSRAVFREFRDRTLPGNHRPDVIGIKAGAQDRSPQAGVLILPRGCLLYTSRCV